MASLKAEKTVGTQLSGQVKKEPAKVSDGAAKGTSKSSGPKKASPKPQEAEKTVGTQLSGHVKKEPAKVSDGAAKSTSKSSGPKKASPKPQEPKKKVLLNVKIH